MAATVPAALKAADVARFAHRAAQLETARPAVAYWLNYWIVDQIISKGLHQADEDSKSYTVQMMDKLEQAKSDHAENDAIMDDMAGQAYIEQFGMETFQRADNAMKANRATRQTADTFQAAATFLELCQIWGPLDPEITAKIKFAKYHALRIAKAVKAGEDPNATNPTPEPSNAEDEPLPSVEQEDALRADAPTSVDISPPRDGLSGNTTQDMSTLGGAPSERFYKNADVPDVSPVQSLNEEKRTSIGGGYFPPAPLDPDVQPLPPPELSHVPDSTFTPANIAPNPIAPGFAAQQPPISTSQFKDDEASTAAAQKHAKFAISALNFEDVPTAVKELREALAALGAT